MHTARHSLLVLLTFSPSAEKQSDVNLADLQFGEWINDQPTGDP
jgi:hypothetical protein